MQYAEVTAYLDDLVRVVRRRLGPDLRAVLLIGSAATGAYVRGLSDLDVAVICAGRLQEQARHGLAGDLSHERLPCPARKLELVVYRADEVAAPSRQPRFELDLNTGEGLHRVSFDPDSETGRHWFLLDLAAARKHGRALLGPRPEEIIGEIPRAWLLEALVESLDWHDAHEPESENARLNACRAWRYALEGAWSSKPAAAAWARERGGDPSSPEVVGRAREAVTRALAGERRGPGAPA
jgi:hypothetical protein